MAGHTAIIGMTSSGKTTLAVEIARAHKRRGDAVLVLDPFRSSHWPADWGATTLALFLEKAKRSRRCALFVEEAGDFGRDPEFAWLFTQARHWGHITYYISQYHAQVPPIVRSNCEWLNLFRVSGRSADFWADDFCQPGIARLAATLPRYHFVRAGRYGEPEVCTLHLKTRSP